ncbi:MAG: hypothetical protein GKR88_10000 [Flavobacteriaceae bacterium]|nr:MAG: hypothetical protein GKR88_10000 [Flavobacteriaceae bacterium]
MENLYQINCVIKSYIQPFERVLAFKELEALAGSNPLPIKGNELDSLNFSVQSKFSQKELANRLAYWERVYNGNELEHIVTKQVRVEATTTLLKKDKYPLDFQDLLPFNGNVPKINRRNLRYGPHGIHEYRGKFFPQLVRSLLNISGASESSKVMDPMCGSGTTLVESMLMGCQTFGLDLNPLSVFISQTKCDVLNVNPELLEEQYKTLRQQISNQGLSKNNKLKWFLRLSIEDQEYLKNWFSEDVLVELDSIVARIEQVKEVVCKNLFKVALSNIIRNISWQKDDDLRVRKHIPENSEINVSKLFLDELDRSVNSILVLLYENQGLNTGKNQLFEGDSRKSAQIFKNQVGKIDAIITSPPYATALPYLDTDRLSLYYLNFLSRSGHRERDYDMIGNREITKTNREAYWTYYLKHKSFLTQEIVDLIDLIYNLNQKNKVGFRRENLPPLLSKYFFDMKRIFESYKLLLRQGGMAFVVVGNNHTNSGDTRIEIETDNLLAKLGESCGLILEEKLSMDMLVSRDIFKKNAGKAESILFFRKA